VSGSHDLQKHFESATSALEGARIEEAISSFESMADRGLAHPDASFNRALSYLKRAHSPSARPGDLGQAIAGFRETLELRRDDETVLPLLDGALLEIAARQSGGKDAQVSWSEPLHVQALRVFDPTLLLGVAAFGAVVFIAALLSTIKAHLRARGLAILILGGIIWSLGSALYGLRQTFVADARYGVVVVPRAEPRDELARKVRGTAPLTEGALVRVAEQRGSLFAVDLGGQFIWIQASDLRLLQKPDEGGE
jgi:hypothetical protein